MLVLLLAAALSVPLANAHLVPWSKGMYGFNGVTGSINYNTDDAVHPLYQLSKDQWWFHHYNNLDEFPPADGDFLELPAGESFTVEIASNRGETTLSFNGAYASDWPDGKTYPEDYNVDTCITSPNMHTQNQSRAAGTAFAIAYTSDIKSVTPENLAVFTVRYHTPWKRLTSYDVPADMPACPEGGCICAWGWVPNGCGQPNMYQVPYRCTVTGAKSTAPVGAPKPPVWCENNDGACTKGPKQMIYWNQAEGDNIEVDGYDANGDFKSPAYNAKCGFPDGAQNDIFTGEPASVKTSAPATTTTTTATATAKSSPSSASSDSSSASSDSSSTGVVATSSSASSKYPSASASAAPSCKTRKRRRTESAVRAHRRRSVHAF
ncbi:hypothetical protein B0H17DRAFT_1046401 [Mycena rosella]|uniref:Uncharacterized protein n=1 Tax=Mycena rosella TaxID=1033263 RepID=A0AAD7GLS5_MYCRO|nr:hypothetical protein B0H17DRAFT_1046401 [Mycena rosella]